MTNLFGIFYYSILDFSKDCDYTLTMVDNLLDLLTGGEHRKTKRVLEERRKLREEEERIRQLLEGKSVSLQGMSDDKIHSMSSFPPDIKVDFGALKSLSDIGIDMKFLDVVGEYYLFLKNSARTKYLVFILVSEYQFTFVAKLGVSKLFGIYGNKKLHVKSPQHSMTGLWLKQTASRISSLEQLTMGGPTDST
jgi:hypothetical protein